MSDTVPVSAFKHIEDCGVDREAKMTVLPAGGCCDPCIEPLVRALNDAGIATRASCCGHGHRPGNIVLADRARTDHRGELRAVAHDRHAVPDRYQRQSEQRPAPINKEVAELEAELDAARKAGSGALDEFAAYGVEQKDRANKAEADNARLREALDVRDMLSNPDTLDVAADEIDCCPGCDCTWHEYDTNAGGCRTSERGGYCPNDLAETLRAIAKAAREALANSEGGE
jgi:hypothetical protein